MADNYQNNYNNMYSMYDNPTPLPPQRPQGRLPPLEQDGQMMNKVGVENPVFVSDNDPQMPVKENGIENGRTNVGGHTEEDLEDSDSGHHHKKEKPLKICSFIVNHHRIAFGVTLGGQIFMYALSVILIMAGYDLLPVEFEGVPLYLTDDDTYLRYLAWKYRDESEIIMRPNTSSYHVGERTENNDVLQVFFEGGGNVLTKSRLKAIDGMEKDFMGVAKWPEYCKAKGKNQDCALPTSLIRFFDGTYAGIGIGPDVNFTDIPGTLHKALGHDATKNLLSGLLGYGFTVTKTEAEATLTRTLFFLGQPLAGYDLTTDSIDDQNELIQDFQVDYWRDKCKDLFDDGLDGMDVYYSSRELLFYDIFKQVVSDMMLAAGSMGFIFIFMLFQTSSLWLTSWALFGIMGSFMGCNLIYRIVLDYKYFGIFHVLSIFIILGIGADNIFVFNDTWRATAHEGHASLEDRLSACYRRASTSMLITTLTTFVAFVSNALSPLLGISAFGIFSAILVAVNYLSAIIFFPTVLIMYHKNWSNWSWPCCTPIKKLLTRPCRKSGGKGEKRPNPVVRFFDGPYWKVVTHKYFRWIFIGACTGLMIMFIYFTSTLEVDEKEMQFYRDGENFQEAEVLNRDGFSQSLDDKNVEVYIAFGLENQDRDDCHKTDFDCKGVTVWDDSFDMNPSPAQQQLMYMCDRIRTLPEEQKYDILRLQRIPSQNNEVEMECYITEMNNYMIAESNLVAIYGKDANFSLPVSELRYQQFPYKHTDLYNTTYINMTDFYRYFESVKAYWIQNGYRNDTTDDYRTYSVKLGESKDLYDTRPILKDPELFYGTRLRYAGIMIKTSLTSGILTYEDGLDMKDAWEDFIQTQVDALPPSLHGGFILTPKNTFHDFKVKKTLAESAVSGIVIGIVLAFVVLTIATTNIIISTMATLTIACVTCTITGLMPMMGWKLSVIESVNLSLVVGLAVDYVVHLSESYNHAAEDDRKLKVRHMLKNMGVSVVSGACSTLGASAFMMAAVLQFFFQFGIFVFCTIGFSLLYSLCLFTPLLGLMGPTGTTGSLKPLIKWLMYKIKGRRWEDPDCQACKGKGFVKQPTNTHL